MKTLLVTVAFLITSVIGAQNGIEPTFTADNGMVTATYYHENGKVSQEGTYNKEGKLHGTWNAYDTNGYKVSTGEYENGVKAGKWLFFKEDGVVEVTYENNKVANSTFKSFKGVVDSE